MKQQASSIFTHVDGQNFSLLPEKLDILHNYNEGPLLALIEATTSSADRTPPMAPAVASSPPPSQDGIDLSSVSKPDSGNVITSFSDLMVTSTTLSHMVNVGFTSQVT